MSGQDLVDAALAGLDLGETVTIPSLEDKSEWDAYEAARRAMAGKLSKAKPATRYTVPAKRAGRDSWEPAHY
jgi:short-subunit dehydrogenase